MVLGVDVLVKFLRLAPFCTLEVAFVEVSIGSTLESIEDRTIGRKTYRSIVFGGVEFAHVKCRRPFVVTFVVRNVEVFVVLVVVVEATSG